MQISNLFNYYATYCNIFYYYIYKICNNMYLFQMYTYIYNTQLTVYKYYDKTTFII